MKDLQAIAALHVQIDNFLESLRKASGAHIDAHDRITDRQRINDHAYDESGQRQFRRYWALG